MLCRQGPSERRSRPWLREKGPAAVAVGRIAPTGRTALRRPLSASHVWTMNYFRD